MKNLRQLITYIKNVDNLFIKVLLVVIALALWKIASNLTELQYSIDELRTQLILIWQRL